MAEVRKYDSVGRKEAPFLTAASTGYTKVTSSHLNLLCAISANETAGVANASAAYRPILGAVRHVGDDDNISVQYEGFVEVLCGESITVASALSGYFGTASGYLYAVSASYALGKGDQQEYGQIKLIKGGSTSVKAIIKL